MKLWTDEIESYRGEAQDFLEALPPVAAFSPCSDPLGDLEQQANMARSLFAERSSHLPNNTSDLAKDRFIQGPGGELRLRVFTPKGVARGLLLHIHGGGWILGSPEMADQQNEALARKHGLVVASVDYRLAPEHPYPAAPDDCEAAAAWLLSDGAEEFGTTRMLIGGESSGAHLALVTANRVRERLGLADQLLGLNLVFGIYDLNGTPSQRCNGGRRDLLDPLAIRTFTEAFTPGMSENQRRHPDISPLNADLSNIPPTLISVGVNDHFLDDSLFLGIRLSAKERLVDLAVFPDSPHGFASLPSKMAEAFQHRSDIWVSAQLIESNP